MESNDVVSRALLKSLQAKQVAFFFKETLELYMSQMGRFVRDDKPIEEWTYLYFFNYLPQEIFLLLTKKY